MASQWQQQQHVGARASDPNDAQRRQWEKNNPVVTDDNFTHTNMEKMTALHKTQPWKTSPRYFQSVKVSVLAALQMMIHAKRGSPNAVFDTEAGGITSAPDKNRRDNWFEVMGMLIGHFSEHEMTVTEAFAIPVDASEVECSMNEVSQMYLLDFLQYHQQGTAQEENGCIGWYHSHPGYTCFLSGTDVGTQQLGQSAQDPWLAIVVDPVHTISTGRLDMKAFRTFPEAYVAAQQQQEAQNRMNRTAGDSRQRPSKASTSVAFSRIKEYGAHAHRYYELPITLVRSKNDEAQLDRLWYRYWALTFSTDPICANRCFTTQRIEQLAEVLESGASRRQKTAAMGYVHDDEKQQLQHEAFHDEEADGDKSLEQSSIQLRYLVSALASEAALDTALMLVKNAAFVA